MFSSTIMKLSPFVVLSGCQVLYNFYPVNLMKDSFEKDVTIMKHNAFFVCLRLFEADVVDYVTCLHNFLVLYTRV